MSSNNIDLVTGGAGFIGSHLTERLLLAGRRVRVLDNFASGNLDNIAPFKENPNFELAVGDIAEDGVATAAMAGVDRVFHLAALSDIVPSVENPRDYFRANVDGTFNVLEAARAQGVRRFVYTASSSCYGIPDNYPTAEDAPVRPQYPYALTKYLGECMALHWAHLYSLPVVSLRLFNVFGPRSRTTGTYGAVFGVFLAQLLAGKPLTIVGDGNQTRDFTFVSDVAAAFAAAADSDVSGRIFNVGTSNPVSVNHLVELLGAKDVVHIPKRPGEPDTTHADTTAIRSVLGWQPQVSFAEGVATVVKNIEYWRKAPVWTPDTIATATQSWFRCLS